MFFFHIFLLTFIIFSHKLKSSSERVAFRQKQKVSVSPLLKGKNEINKRFGGNMYKTLIEKNGRGDEVIIRTYGTGNPRDNDGAPFDVAFNKGSETTHLYLTYKEVKTLAQGLLNALHTADREYEDEQEDTRTVSELTTDIMRGFMGC
jgi:predicted SnoaL-like aldol condensation-catalyzing enzyme